MMLFAIGIEHALDVSAIGVVQQLVRMINTKTVYRSMMVSFIVAADCRDRA
jgi:hypothetical protein